MSRLGSIFLLGAVSAALWWYYSIAEAYHLFGGTFGFVLDVAASIASAALLVAVVGEALIALAFTVLTTAQPTGFERAGVYAILSIFAVGLVLSHFGVAITTVLATSAVLTAVVGLALQPTLGALIAGLTLNRMLKIGDGIVHGGEALTITEMAWRSVSTTRGDGSRLLLSNARVLDGGFEILSRDRPVRTEIVVVAPFAVEPQRISDILTSCIADIGGIDVARPISVGPAGSDADKAIARYRVRFWVRDFRYRTEMGEEVLRRSWYGFQRQGIASPVGGLLAEHNAQSASLKAPYWRRLLSTALAEAQRSPERPLEHVSLDAAVENGILLLYTDLERIVMPDRVEAHQCLLIDGRVRRITFAFSNDPALEMHATSSGRLAELQRLTTELAERIGPFAELAVQRVAAGEPDLLEVRRRVAEEIMDQAERDRFLARRPLAAADQTEGPGLLLKIGRGATNELQADMPLRAIGRVAIVAIPPQCLEAPPALPAASVKRTLRVK